MTREKTRYILSVVERNLVEQSLTVIGNGGRPMLSMVVGGTDEAQDASFVHFMDIRDRFVALRDGVEQRNADLCVFVYDGWIEDPLRRALVSRRDALLVVALSRWKKDSRAYSLEYEFHEGKGARAVRTTFYPERIDEYSKPIFGDRLVEESAKES